MIEFLVCIVLLIVLYYGFFFVAGILRGLPYIGRGLSARWSDNPIRDVSTPKSTANYYSFNWAGFIVALGLITAVLLFINIV